MTKAEALGKFAVLVAYKRFAREEGFHGLGDRPVGQPPEPVFCLVTNKELAAALFRGEEFAFRHSQATGTYELSLVRDGVQLVANFSPSNITEYGLDGEIRARADSLQHEEIRRHVAALAALGVIQGRERPPAAYRYE